MAMPRDPLEPPGRLSSASSAKKIRARVEHVESLLHDLAPILSDVDGLHDYYLDIVHAHTADVPCPCRDYLAELRAGSVVSFEQVKDSDRLKNRD